MAFLVDDILLFPIKGLVRIFREIHNAAEQELVEEAEGLTEQLSELYMMLETEMITEEEFEEKEKEILDRLDALQEEDEQGDGEEDDDDEDDEDEDEDEDEDDDDEE